MIKIYTLVEARRAIRRLHLNTERIARDLKKPPALKSAPEKTLSNLQFLSRLLQQAQINCEDIRTVAIALQTQLLDATNLVVRLQRNAAVIEDQGRQQIDEIEDRLSHLTTKFESKLQVLLTDLARRLTKQYTVQYLVREIQDREIGVLRLKKQNDERVALCAVMTDPLDLEEETIKAIGVNRYKIFMNEIPYDLSLENFKDFLSPSKAVVDILAYLQEEGF